MRNRTGFILHLHPPSVPVSTLRFSLSFGLGGICVTLLLLLAGSGILLLPIYAPAAGSAYASVAGLYGPGKLGGWVRNLHHLSANLLVAALGLHLLRVLLTGAFDHPARRNNWLVGLCLLLLGLGANFSGYLLPWDQRAYWAVTVFTGMLGYLPLAGPQLADVLRSGTRVGPATLKLFFVLHIVVIPAAIMLLSAWHFWLVRRAGGLVRAETEEKKPLRVPVVPHLVAREAAVGLGTAALVMLLAIFFPAPLGPAANPGLSPNPARAPWYFIGIQELMLHLHPAAAVGAVPLLLLGGLAALPWIKEMRLEPGIWLNNIAYRRLLGLAALLCGLLLAAGTTIGDDLWLRPAQTGANGILTRGVLPLLLLAGLPAAIRWLPEKWLRIPRPAAGALLLLAGCGAVAGLTLVGLFLRGPGMKLILF